MARILVVAHLNHDRIWQLTGPLQSGARISWRNREITLGGGGYFTGLPFLISGHEVALVSSLGNDTLGSEARDYLASSGFDMQHVITRDTGTHLTEIFLEPSGERTILTAHDGPMRRFTLSSETNADAAYINCFNPDAKIVDALNSTAFVASQFPLSETSVSRPADLMIGSRGDFPGLDDTALWQKAFALCSGRLKHLVMTDGARTITIYDGRETRTVQPMRRATVRSTIGAGDHFSASLISAMLSGAAIEDAASAASKATTEWLEQRDCQPLETI